MFGRNKKPEAPTGAREKIEAARKLREAGRYNINMSSGGDDIRYPSQMIPVAVVYGLATILAMLLTDSASSPLSGLHLTGVSSIDHFVTSTDIATITGDRDEDRLFTVLGRGAAFFVLTGLVPGIAYVIERFFFYKRVMPLIICWGVIVAVMLSYLFIPLDQIIPFIRDMVSGLVG